MKQKLSQEAYNEAMEFLLSSYPGVCEDVAPIENDGECLCVLDSKANGEDPVECLAEYRFWRSPIGRHMEVEENFESGRY